MKAILLVNGEPSWFLDREEIDKFYEMLSILPGDMSPPVEINSRYRGIRIETVSEVFRIYDGAVTVFSNGELRSFIDEDRSFEIWLFSTSRNQISDDIYNQLLVNEFK